MQQTVSDPISRPPESSASEGDGAVSPSRQLSGANQDEGQESRRSQAHELLLVPGTTVFWKVEGVNTLITFNTSYSQPVYFQYDEVANTAMPLSSDELGNPEHGGLQLQGFFKELDENTMVPATMDDFKAYFGGIAMHSSGAKLPPRVLVSIECGKAKGLVTYKQDAPNGTVLYEENGVLKECTPTQFELHKAGSNHRSWRKSFRVAGCLKVAKAAKPAAQLASATICDMQRYLEAILGIKRKKAAPNPAPGAQGFDVPPNPRAVAAALAGVGSKDVMSQGAPRPGQPMNYRGGGTPPLPPQQGCTVDMFGAVPIPGRPPPPVGFPPGPGPAYPPQFSAQQRRDPRASLPPPKSAGTPGVGHMGAPQSRPPGPQRGPPMQSQPAGPAYLAVPLSNQAPSEKLRHLPLHSLSQCEAEAIKLIMSSTSGEDMSHAVQGIMYHVVKFHDERFPFTASRVKRMERVEDPYRAGPVREPAAVFDSVARDSPHKRKRVAQDGSEPGVPGALAFTPGDAAGPPDEADGSLAPGPGPLDQGVSEVVDVGAGVAAATPTDMDEGAGVVAGAVDQDTVGAAGDVEAGPFVVPEVAAVLVAADVPLVPEADCKEGDDGAAVEHIVVTATVEGDDMLLEADASPMLDSPGAEASLDVVKDAEPLSTKSDMEVEEP